MALMEAWTTTAAVVDRNAIILSNTITYRTAYPHLHISHQSDNNSKQQQQTMSVVQKKEEAEELLFMSDFGPISNAKMHEVRANTKQLTPCLLSTHSLASLASNG